VISGVGDVFVMKMYFAHLGDYEMNNHVVEYQQDRRIGWDATIVTEIYDCSRAPDKERAGMDNGKIWIESMTRTLERLDALCAGHCSG
jgi:hypothetical protein